MTDAKQGTFGFHAPVRLGGPGGDSAMARENRTAQEPWHPATQMAPRQEPAGNFRRGDPATARDAGRRSERSGRGESHRASIAEVLTASTAPMTFHEIAWEVSRRGRVGMDKVEVMRRLSDAPGRRQFVKMPPRECHCCGTRMVTWALRLF